MTVPDDAEGTSRSGEGCIGSVSTGSVGAAKDNPIDSSLTVGTPSCNPLTVTDWGWLRAEVESAADAFVDQLRRVPDQHAQVPNLDWDVRELAAHLVSLPAFYIRLNAATEPFTTPDDFASYSKSIRAHLDHHDLDELVQLFSTELDRLFEQLGPDGSAPWMLYRPTTVANTASGLLGELLMHGMDLSAITGDRVTMTGRQGHAIVQQSMALVPAFVDPMKAAGCAGTYHFGFPAGPDYGRLDYTWQVADGTVTVTEGRPDRADARLRAHPAVYAMVSLGRYSQIRAALTAKMIAYGPKPWKLAALARAAVDGV
jgi:uncharacterized protein (TIGR03083 family)